MRKKMFVLLEAEIMGQGKTNVALANDIGIKPRSLFRKRVGESDFTIAEARGLMDALKLSPEKMVNIFFD